MQRPRLADRVDAGATAGFQGRHSELSVLRRLLSRPEDLPRVLDVHGPPGIGKTTLLQAFRRLAVDEDLAIATIVDASEFEHRVEDLEARLRERLPAWPPPPAGKPVVVAIDTFERMTDMEYSFRTRFLEQLSGRVLVVVAGRRPLGGLQGGGLGWRGLVESIRLEALNDQDALAYLHVAGVEGDAARRIANWAGGHPLALSIAGELAGGLGVQDVDSAAASTHVIRALVERLANEIRNDDVRALVDAASLVRTFDEELLEAMVGAVPPRAFDELARLSVVQVRGARLGLHESVRHFLSAHVRTSRPVRYQQYRINAFEHLRQAAASGGGADATFQLLWLAEDAVIQRTFFDDRPAPELRAATRADEAFMRAAAAAHAAVIPGAVAKRLLEDIEVFLAVAPERFLVAVDANGEPIGFTNTIPLNRATLPALRERWAFYLDALPVRALTEMRGEPAGSAAAGLVTGVVIPKTGHDGILPALLRDAIVGHLRETRRMVLITPYARYKDLARSLLFARVGQSANLFEQAEAHEAFELDLAAGGFDAWIGRLLGLEPGHAPRPPTAANRVEQLTAREWAVAELVREGLTNKEIGRRLGISARTVEVHVANAAGKLGARSRTQLATMLPTR